MFWEDLQFGESFEHAFVELFKYSDVTVMGKRFKDYDVVVRDSGKPVYYEVKADRVCKNTGNIAIEYENRGEPSGIITTKADYFIYFVLYNDRVDVYEIPVKVIKEYIRDKKYRFIKDGGDKKLSKMYMFDKNMLSGYMLMDKVTHCPKVCHGFGYL